MFRLHFTLLFSVILFCTSLSAYAATPAADKVFPDSTKGFVSIRNFKDFSEQWQQTQFGQLMSDPLMAEFKLEVQTQLTERMGKTFGLSFEGLASLPTGEVAVGMVAVPEQIPGYVLLMDVAGKRADTDEYLAKLTQKLEAGVKKSTETYKGQQITILTFPPPEMPQMQGNARSETKTESLERKAYYMLREDVLLASDQLHLLQLFADRIAEQGGKSLADVEAYQVVMKRCLDDMSEGTQPIIRWYIEPFNYGESVQVLLRGPAAQKRKDKPSIFSILKQQGFDAIQGVGGIVSVKTEVQESVYRTFVYTKKPYRQAMQMLVFPDSTNFAPPIWMPADLARCTMFYVDPLAIFDNFGVLFDAFIGEEGVWKDILDGLEKDIHGPQVNIRDELIAHLGNRILGMSRYEKPITVKSESIVVAVELKADHEQGMSAGLEKLFGTDPEMAGMEHNSYMIWHRVPGDFLPPIDIVVPGLVGGLGDHVKPPTPANQPQNPPNPPPTFPDGGVVVAKGCLFVSTDIEYLKVILDRLDAPEESAKSTIVNETEYKEVDRIFAGMGLTDKPHFFQFFARTHETLRPTYEMIRLNQMAQSQALLAKLLNGILSPDEEPGVRRQVFDGSTMPEFGKVQHYFGQVGIYGVSEANGYFIKGFALERAQ